MAHIMKRCSRCRGRVPPRERTCECGGKRIVWLAKYVDPDGRERAHTFDKEKDAETFLAEIESAKGDNRYVDPKVGGETLASLFARFMEQTTLEASTRSQWEGIWRLHIDPPLGATPIARITKNAVITMRDAPRTSEGNEALKIVKRLLFFSVDDGILLRNVAARVKPRETERRKIEILTPAELRPSSSTSATAGARWCCSTPSRRCAGRSSSGCAVKTSTSGRGRSPSSRSSPR
jgi:hypothetical protein